MAIGTKKRIADVQQTLYLNPAPVNASWATAAQAAADVHAATGIPLVGVPFSIPLHTYIMLWEGPHDPDDFACLRVDNTGAASFVDINAAATSFSTPPETSISYVISIRCKKP